VAAVVAVVLTGVSSTAQQTTPRVPDPGVAQITTLEGEFVRIAYNNEGFVTLGYRVANGSIGEEWMMLEMGTTLRKGVQTYKLTRNALSIETPDAKKIAMATNADYLNVDLRATEQRATVVRDSVNYFPPEANQGCQLNFFAASGSGRRAYDDVELNSNRACLGRVYFKIPGGIKYGQHWLNVQFPTSVVRVPFRILTKEEEKTLSKSWKDIKKQLDEALKKGK
jgi:hypothetical protein